MSVTITLHIDSIKFLLKWQHLILYTWVCQETAEVARGYHETYDFYQADAWVEGFRIKDFLPCEGQLGIPSTPKAEPPERLEIWWNIKHEETDGNIKKPLGKFPQIEAFLVRSFHLRPPFGQLLLSDLHGAWAQQGPLHCRSANRGERCDAQGSSFANAFFKRFILILSNTNIKFIYILYTYLKTWSKKMRKIFLKWLKLGVSSWS